MPLKIETPNIDPIFSLDCLKLNEMKGLFKTIFDYLQKMGHKLDSIPDFSDLSMRLGRLERGHADLEGECKKTFKELKEGLDMLETNHGERL